MQPHERLVIFLLAAINFTHILDFMIMMPLGNYLMPYYDISPAQFSLLVGSYTLTAAGSGFVAAFFVDQYDRKKFLRLSRSPFRFLSGGKRQLNIEKRIRLVFERTARCGKSVFQCIIARKRCQDIAEAHKFQRGSAQ